MFALARLARLSTLAAVASIVSFAQGCSAPEEDSAEGAGAVVETNEKPVLSRDPNRLIDVPFYFSVPKDAVADSVRLDRRGYSYPTLWNPSTNVESAGLRVIAIKQDLPVSQKLPSDATNEEKARVATANQQAKKVARDDMARQLASSGVLEAGDIVLSFRPENAATVPYMHVQMGTTHASLTYMQNGVAKNVDSPIRDNEYTGGFNTLHFTGGVSGSGNADLGADALHILRPRALGESEARREQMNFWASKAAANRANGRIAFNSEYLAPSAPTTEEARKLATAIGRHILGLPAPDLKLFCSEFAWHMLALSNCSEDDIRTAGSDGAQCAEDGIVFKQMPLIATDGTIGLGEGPLHAVLGAPIEQRGALIGELFTSMEAARMSSGHRATAAATAGLMGPLALSYQSRAGLPLLSPEGEPLRTPDGQVITPEVLAAGIEQVNAAVKPNYSPTAFIALSTQPAESRAVDYVATVVFVDSDADYEKARSLSQNPVP